MVERVDAGRDTALSVLPTESGGHNALGHAATDPLCANQHEDAKYAPLFARRVEYPRGGFESQ